MRLVLLVAGLGLAASSQAQIRSVTDPSALRPEQPSAATPTPAPSPPALAKPAGERLDNNTVIALVRAGLGPEAVIAKINASMGSYDTSTNALIALKQAGVSDGVIAAMLNRSSKPTLPTTLADNGNPDPLAPHAPGIYLFVGGSSPRMVRIDATTSNQTKTTNIWGYAFTSGIAPMRVKTVIPNAYARVRATGRRPSFYFFFNPNSPLAGASEFGNSFSIAATSPNEFSLVKFDQKKDRREASIGSVSIGGVKTGVSDKARISFNYEDVAPGVFKVTPAAELTPGQYGFVYSMGGGTGATAIARIFDFTIS